MCASKWSPMCTEIVRPRMLREKRSLESGHEFRNMKAYHKVHQWRTFPTHSKNKSLLIKFITGEWQKEKYRGRIGGKEILLTTEDRCFEIPPTSATRREELTSTQEEADIRVLLHAAHAAEGYRAVVITSEVYILSLAFKVFIPCPWFVKCGQQTRTEYIDVSQAARMLGSELCRSLPGLHAFTGCDSVSVFSGNGKVTALKLVKQSKTFQTLSSRNWCGVEPYR